MLSLEVQQTEQLIREAFKDTSYPGDDLIVDSIEGDEPYLLKKEFKGKIQWDNLPTAFLDRAPDGYASALSFFSKEAFHFYLPAYLIADLKEGMKYTNLTFHLWHGLTTDTMNETINPLRYGNETWFEYVKDRFSVFTSMQKKAVAAFLNYKLSHDSEVLFNKNEIQEALYNFWDKK